MNCIFCQEETTGKTRLNNGKKISICITCYETTSNSEAEKLLAEIKHNQNLKFNRKEKICIK